MTDLMTYPYTTSHVEEKEKGEPDMHLVDYEREENGATEDDGDLGEEIVRKGMEPKQESLCRITKHAEDPEKTLVADSGWFHLCHDSTYGRKAQKKSEV